MEIKARRKMNSKGFTLVETLVSMTLLVVIASILLTGVMAAGRISGRSADITQAGYQQAAILEQKGPGTQVQSGTARIFRDGLEVFVAGKYYSVADESTGVEFSLFVPDKGTGEPDV